MSESPLKTPRGAVAFLLVSFASIVVAASNDDLGKIASWTAPTTAEVRGRIEQWLGPRTSDAAVRQQLDVLWPAAGPAVLNVELLERIAQVIETFDEQAKPLVELCRGDVVPTRAPQFEMLSSEQTAPFVRNHLRLLFARWLAQHDLYDEAYEILKSMTAGDVCDPASLLFYQAVTCHRLLKKDECTAAAQRLVENEGSVPLRYRTIARLIAADIEPLQPDSLDEVARLMGDIRRRLQLSRAGKTVRQQEDEVIAKLDKMIEEAEKKQQQMAAASQNSTQPSNPAQDSTPMGGKGPGDVGQKSTGKAAGWGNLPPKEREEALQQMSKDLPAHFRELIEEYFRKLARDGGR